MSPSNSDVSISAIGATPEDFSERRPCRESLASGDLSQGGLARQGLAKPGDEGLASDDRFRAKFPMTVSHAQPDELAIRFLSAAPVRRVKLLQKPVDTQERWRRGPPGMGSVTTPSPVRGRCNDLGSDGIEHDVSGDLQKIRIAFHEARSETSLKQMPHAIVSTIELLSVNTVELAEGRRQVPVRCLQQEVVVVSHQAIRMNHDVESFDDRPECRQEPSSIVIVEKDVLPGVSPRDDVVDASRHLQTEGSGHGSDWGRLEWGGESSSPQRPDLRWRRDRGCGATNVGLLDLTPQGSRVFFGDDA